MSIEKKSFVQYDVLKRISEIRVTLHLRVFNINYPLRRFPDHGVYVH